MTPQELYGYLISYGINEIEIDRFFHFENVTICDLSYDFRVALFDISEELFYEELERAVYRTNGWILS